MELKGIDYEYKSINLVKNGGEQYSDEFTKQNPKQEVPSIEIDGQIFSQSINRQTIKKLPIIEYLNETRQHEPNLFPKDHVKRTKAGMIAEIINSGIQPFQNLSVTKRLQQNGFTDQQKNEWLDFYLSKGLRAVEDILKETSGKYCVGDEITIADLCLVPQVYSAKRFNVNLTEFPNVVRVNDELEKLPAFIKAHAHRQPDTPIELREN